MRPSQMPPEKLGLATRDANETRPPKRIGNSWLPAIEASPKTLRTFNRLREPASLKNDEPFNYHDLLEEVRRNEPDARPWPSIPPTDLNSPDSLAEIPKGKQCSNCTQLAKAQQVTAASLQVARNVIESLERSVNLLQTKLALYERDMGDLRQAISRFNEGALSPSTQEEKTKNHLSSPRGDEVALTTKANSTKHALASVEEGAEPTIAVPTNEASSGGGDLTAFGQIDNETRNEIGQRLAELKAEIKMLATALVAQNEHIERLKTANMMLATRSDVLTKNTQAVATAQKSTQEKIQFQTKAVEFLISELQAERAAADYDTAKLLYALRHEHSERLVAERNVAAIKNELVFALPKLTIASKSTE